jgi:hypothetical protein
VASILQVKTKERISREAHPGRPTRMNRHHKACPAASSRATRLRPVVRKRGITQIATFNFLPTSALSLDVC